jgi:leader peptidase (prepilin peptidase)/N-methyltransferase
LLISVVATVASGLTLLLCWRFAGAGFGDVRLAVLGGLGLGHATHRGLLMALAAFILTIATQAMLTLLRGGNRRTTIAYGPALAIGFLLAATV